MPRLASQTQHDSLPVELDYVDTGGTGEPVILIHGWPLAHPSWEYQIAALAEAGKRVIAYTRRGFGESDKPWGPYDYDTLAGDLKNVIDTLDLRGVTLVGFSMGGGEVARYLGTYGSERISRAVLVAAVTPYLQKTGDNPTGVDQATLDGIVEGIVTDRVTFLDGFVKQFFSVKKAGKVVDEATLQYNLTTAALASPKATKECAIAFGTTDFRADLAKIDVPTLIVHGTDDQVVPIEASADVAATIIKDNQYLKIDGAPHGLNYTHKQELNTALLNFLG